MLGPRFTVVIGITGSNLGASSIKRCFRFKHRNLLTGKEIKGLLAHHRIFFFLFFPPPPISGVPWGVHVSLEGAGVPVLLPSRVTVTFLVDAAAYSD
jgi:hypothetical protein